VSVSQGNKCPLNPKVGHGPEAMAVAAGVPICTVHTGVDPSVVVRLSLNGRISPWTRQAGLDEVTRFVRRTVISEFQIIGYSCPWSFVIGSAWAQEPEATVLRLLDVKEYLAMSKCRGLSTLRVDQCR
jgi:hypothetical protein